MQTWEAIRSRRNVRSFAQRPIEPADLDRILEAGWRSPSSANRQRWEFVLVTDREQLRELAQVWRSAQHVADSAATVALAAPVADDPAERESIAYDLGQATMTMMLAAADLGIGSGHAAVSDQSLARRILGLPDDRFAAYLIAFGHPQDRTLTPIARPSRRPFDDVVRRGSW